MKSVNSFLPNFSHLYVEENASDYPLTHELLKRYSNSVFVPIKDYKTVFNRGKQNFQLQKRSMKLILAVKKPPFIYHASSVQQNSGFRNHYYITPLINCLYNCDYCFLQGMYPSGNMVLFVNSNDFFSAVGDKIQKRSFSSEPLFLSVSYNTDLIAFENIVPLSRAWIDYCKQTEDLILEIRTKSALFQPLENITPVQNVLLVWTLSPQKVIDVHENNTPALERRLKAVGKAIARGWNVRLCFDPVIVYENWQRDYVIFLKRVFAALAADNIKDITVGVFRMNKGFFHRIRKQKPLSKIYYSRYEIYGDIATLPSEEQKMVREFMAEVLTTYLPREKILFWDG